jgi:hypothetical protein
VYDVTSGIAEAGRLDPIRSSLQTARQFQRDADTRLASFREGTSHHDSAVEDKKRADAMLDAALAQLESLR